MEVLGGEVVSSFLISKNDYFVVGADGAVVSLSAQRIFARDTVWKMQVVIRGK